MRKVFQFGADSILSVMDSAINLELFSLVKQYAFMGMLLETVAFYYGYELN